MNEIEQRKIPKYWTEEVRAAADKAQDFQQLAQVALELAARLGRGIIIVCGPVSTGGRGSIPENLRVLNDAVHSFIENGELVFDQTPFEDVIKRLRAELKDQNGLRTLEEFYHPLISSDYVTEMRFLPDWQSSEGAKWEHRLGQSLGKQITYLQ